MRHAVLGGHAGVTPGLRRPTSAPPLCPHSRRTTEHLHAGRWRARHCGLLAHCRTGRAGPAAERPPVASETLCFRSLSPTGPCVKSELLAAAVPRRGQAQHRRRYLALELVDRGRPAAGKEPQRGGSEGEARLSLRKMLESISLPCERNEAAFDGVGELGRRCRVGVFGERAHARGDTAGGYPSLWREALHEIASRGRGRSFLSRRGGMLISGTLRRKKQVLAKAPGRDSSRRLRCSPR